MEQDPDKARGLSLNRFSVKRTDGSSEPGGKHEECFCFVLDLEHDKFARPAMEAYAAACESEYPPLAADLRKVLASKKAAVL